VVNITKTLIGLDCTYTMVVPGLIGLTGWIAVLIGTVGWMLLTLLLRKWPDTSLTPLELTPMLSHLLALALGFELQVGGPENIWLISWMVLRPHTPMVNGGTSLSGMVDKDE
jgi:hypothetical protein